MGNTTSLKSSTLFLKVCKWNKSKRSWFPSFMYVFPTNLPSQKNKKRNLKENNSRSMLGRNSISKVVRTYLLFHCILYYSFLSLFFFSLMTNVPISYYKDVTTKEDKNAFYHASGLNYFSGILFQLAMVFFTILQFHHVLSATTFWSARLVPKRKNNIFLHF